MRYRNTVLFSSLVLQMFWQGYAGAEEVRPEWIWASAQRGASATASLHKKFSVTQVIKKAELRGVADFTDCEIMANQKSVVEIEAYGPIFHLDVKPFLVDGENELELRCAAAAGPSAVFVQLQLEFQDGSHQRVVSDTSWLNQHHKPVTSLGRVADQPWGDSAHSIAINAFDDYTQWKRALGGDKSTDPSSFMVAPGFEIELLRSAQKDEGSWVSLEVDPKGRLVIAKEDRGLLRMTLSTDGKQIVKVETINDTLEECRGLLFAFDSLYVNANNSKGLYRLRDTDGDDIFDEEELLYASSGNVGHGRNDLALGPDNMIYAIHGDAVDLPDDFFDRTSPFRESRRGKKMREGHLIRMDRDGKQRELIAAGLRNPYGIDFNTDGEPFTYDADAEFDMGSPWYRPTRVDHLVSGSDFGWRGVTGDWPPYYPDHVDNALPNLDIGKGSPTGVKFGTKSNFPPKYQQALFILDWAYGRIVAVHMTPRGSSYASLAETFVKGRPLNVTDLDFGHDGSMYFVTGGRKTQAGLYRVRYVGPKVDEAQPSAQQLARHEHAKLARRVRRELESFHGRQDESIVDKAWQHFDDPDPRIRYAARTAVEHQPLDWWRDLALAESNPIAALTACMGLARSEDEQSLTKIIVKLNEMPLDELHTTQELSVLQTYSHCLSKIKKLDDSTAAGTTDKLDALYPDGSVLVNQELSKLLVKLNAKSVLSKTLRLLATAESQPEQLHYLFVLRNVKYGWTLDDRRKYFSALRQTSDYLTGQGMPGFLQKIREEAMASLSETERSELEPLLAAVQHLTESEPIIEREFVRKWSIDDLISELPKVDDTSDIRRGRDMFVAASCNRCHRVGVEGTLVGPDLTSASRRFSRRDLLDSILSPSKVIPENYRSVRIETTGGKVYTGRIIPSGDYRSPTLRLATNPPKPHEIIEITKSEIESQTTSPVSWMPDGLLNTLTKDEILDLLAFIEAGGV